MIKLTNKSLSYELNKMKDDIKLSISDLKKGNKNRTLVSLVSVVNSLDILERLVDNAEEDGNGSLLDILKSISEDD